MTSIERTAYPRFKRYYIPNELKEVYTPTKTEIAFALSVTTGEENYFNCLVLLKSFQRLGYFPKIKDNPADLINVAIEELVKERYELPGFYTLERLIAQSRKEVNQQLFSQVISQLSPEYIQRLNTLLDNYASVERSPFNDLKKLPSKSSRNHLNDFIVHLTWLETLGDVKVYLKSLTQSKIKHFASEAKALNAGEIRKITVAKRLTLILCLINSAQVQTRDALVEMFLRQIKKIHYKAQEKLDLIRQQQQEKTEKLVSVLTDVLQICNSDNNKDTSFEQITDIFQERGGIEQLLTECEEINAYQKNNYIPLLWGFYKSHRRAFFRVFNTLKVESTTSDQKLVKAFEFLLSNSHRRGEWLEAEVDLSFASQLWQKLVIVQQKKVPN